MTAGELGCLVAGMIFGMLSVVLYLVPQLGNSSRLRGSRMNGQARGNTGFSGPTMDGPHIYYPHFSGRPVVEMRDD